MNDNLGYMGREAENFSGQNICLDSLKTAEFMLMSSGRYRTLWGAAEQGSNEIKRAEE